MCLKKKLLHGILLIAILSGCAATRHAASGGVYHTVGKGETLWRISRTYGVDAQDVAEANNINDPAKITEGRKIFIPGARSVRKVEPRKPFSKPHGIKETPEGSESPDKIVVEKGRFAWPVAGEVISPFGVRGQAMHYGIDIKATKGAPVKAADDGRVVYSDDQMKGYGNVVILRHADNYYTVYAHNEKNLVKAGDNVRKGEEIALIGDSGNAGPAHLHFEIRQGKKTRNPLFFLP
ncbi:MAG: peptidoglycan DD-metalloendopeptidase family protein [Deltaproteobacteria bacterium]|nr:peptidoglycan DD-metalloendopeptidase family protein [Deltaproteobacteria bacterium]